MVSDQVKAVVEDFIHNLDDINEQQYLLQNYQDLLENKGKSLAYFLYANTILNFADPSGHSYPQSYDAYSKYAWKAAALWQELDQEMFRDEVEVLLQKLWSAVGPAGEDSREMIALVRTDLVDCFKTIDWELKKA